MVQGVKKMTSVSHCESKELPSLDGLGTDQSPERLLGPRQDRPQQMGCTDFQPWLVWPCWLEHHPIR